MQEKATMNNIPICLSIKKLKQAESELIRCFDIDHTCFCEELQSLFTSKYMSVMDGSLQFPLDYSKDAIALDEYVWQHAEYDLILLIPDTVDFKISKFLEQYFKSTKEGDRLVMQTLEILTLVHYRNSRTVMTDWDGVVEDYNKYAWFIRPDMLKLYIALNTDRKYKDEKVRIALHDNPPIHLNNFEHWFETVLSRYLDRYLGVTSVDEAQQELDEIYGKKKGKRFCNKLATEYMWGIYHLLENSESLNTRNKRAVSRKVCEFIITYLEFIGIPMITENSTLPDEIDTVKGQLTYLLSHYPTIQDLKKDKIYKCSPNNSGSNMSVTGYY